jgi:hypothetical protein
MGEAESLMGKGQTGKPTVDQETEAIQLLSMMIEQLAAQCNGQCQGGMGIGVLLQMMGMGSGAGSSPGGSSAGGNTNQQNIKLTGDPKGNSAESRNVSRASGKESESFPIEYREALQNYFNSIDQDTTP